MGVVIRQSFWTSIASYVGIIIGYLNTVLLLPYFLTDREIGIYLQIQSAVTIIVPLSLLGMNSLSIRYHHKYDSTNIKYFHSFLFGGYLIGLALTFLVFFVCKPLIISAFDNKTPEFSEYYWMIFYAVAFLSFFNLLETFARSNLKQIYSTFLRDNFSKILKAIFVFCFGYGLLSFNGLVNSLAWSNAIIGGMLLIFIIRNGYISRLAFRFSSQIFEKNTMVSFALYATIGALGSTIVLNIDMQMISSFLGPELNAVYGVAAFMAMTIELPRKAISQIVIPLITKALDENNVEEIQMYYRKLSNNQSVIGTFLLVLLLINLESIFNLIPNGDRFIAGIPVIYILGGAKLIEMFFGSGGIIISYSKYYKFNFLLIVFLGVLTVITNYFFIPSYGIEGAALASFISLLIFNFLRFLFIYQKYRIQPFTFQIVLTIVFGIALFVANYLIDVSWNPFVDILTRTFITSIIFLIGAYYLKLSTDLNGIADHWLRKPFNRI